MDWGSIKGLIGTAAPIVGTLIGGPAGAAVGGAVSKLLGVEETPEAVESELKNNPEALLKLKEYEYTHKEKLQEMELETLKTTLADVQSARSRQVETQKATGKVDVNFYALTWLVVLGFFALMYGLLFVTIPVGQTNVVYMLFGTLASGFGAVMQYFYGTSKGSSDKSLQLMQIHKQAIEKRDATQ